MVEVEVVDERGVCGCVEKCEILEGRWRLGKFDETPNFRGANFFSIV